MLAQYKKPRTNAQAKKNQVKIVEKKRQAKAEREEQSGTDSDYSDSSDSEYEEILVSNLKKYPLPKHASEKEDPEALPPPLKLERQVAGNHSNHFTESKKDPLKQPKKARKKIVIKKYYQQRQSVEKKSPSETTLQGYARAKPEKQKEEEPKSKPIDIPQPKRTSYIGLGGASQTQRTSHSMRNRLLNW
jgi:hypothetical protein